VFNEVLLLGSAQCFEKVDGGPINMTLSKEEKKVMGVH
jgi:hypothetical protein